MTAHPPGARTAGTNSKPGAFVEFADAFMGSVATGASAAPFRIIAVE